MNAVGIDLWDRKVGIAISIEGVVIPKEIVPRVKVIQHLQKILNDYNVQDIVVGLPYDLYGTNTKQLEKTQKFIEKLIDIFPDYNIIGHDERFTTFEAKREVSKGTEVDDISAQLILESYLQTQ